MPIDFTFFLHFANVSVIDWMGKAVGESKPEWYLYY